MQENLVADALWDSKSLRYASGEAFTSAVGISRRHVRTVMCVCVSVSACRRMCVCARTRERAGGMQGQKITLHKHNYAVGAAVELAS